ncbi:phosphate--nucleotide phosphotransferase [Opitutaceae bacterium EW11]|nr:phosphate--nucleotide phosphotransferase [Opitutaceae bacterium EW11]
MKIKLKSFRAEPDRKLKLKHHETCLPPLYDSDEEYEKLLGDSIGELSELQNLLYAHGRYSLLLIFQAMDAAGKDSAIKHVMSGVNPQGCQVYSFKQPSAEDLAHDFLWRTTRCLPERGRIGIFNRSYYEEVLIVRVHPEILQKEPLPAELFEDEDLWKGRYRSIRDFEAHLVRNGTRVLKFYLHLSKTEQKKRFLARLGSPDKNWKFSRADLVERKLWDEYMDAYEKAIEETSTEEAPWYVVPADDKKNARLIISAAIIDTLKSLDMDYPTLSAARKAEYAEIKKQLEK